MSALANYRTLLGKHVSPLLRREGFQREGRTFRRFESDICDVVELQKSIKSHRDRVFFTINWGIGLNWLSKYIDGLSADGAPEVDNCHFRQRVHTLNGSEIWWEIVHGQPLTTVWQEVERILTTVVLASFRRYVGEQDLRDLWLKGDSPGLTEVERLVYLSSLLKKSNMIDALEQTKTDMKRLLERSPVPRLASHLEKLQQVSWPPTSK